MNCTKRKKGVSAVISTVLLVIFVVVMGLIITGWSTKLIKRNIEKGESRVGTDLDCMNVNVMISPGSDTIVFVENNNMKEKKLSGFISKFGKGNNVFVDYTNQDTEIEAFGAGTLDYSVARDRNLEPMEYSPDGIEKIEVVPRIELENGEVVDCVKKTASYTF